MIFDRFLASNRSPSSDRSQTVLRRITVFFRRNKQWLILILAALLLLLLLFPSSDSEPSEPSSDCSAHAALLRRDLEDLLSDLQGVGKCTVFITFSDGGETVYAYDEDIDTDAGGTSVTKEYVLIASRSEGLILKVYPPSVLGVAVICQGGDSTRVKNDVTEILSRTLGISADRISVKKMSS